MKFTDAEERFFRRVRTAGTLAFALAAVLTALAVKDGRLSFDDASDNLKTFVVISLVAINLRTITIAVDVILIALVRPRR